ncbi:hypothetical protein HID58_014002, partial [Brassica napus]
MEEKIRCPLLRKGVLSGHKTVPAQSSNAGKIVEVTVKPHDRVNFGEGPPGFPPLFPELSKQDNIMALQYISHADETERMARIQRVRQGIEDSKTESSIRLMRITGEVDKGKGHVFNYLDTTTQSLQNHPLRDDPQRQQQRKRLGDEEAESSYSPLSIVSAPVQVPTVFRLGPSSEGRVAGNQNHGKAPRKRPQSWKRKLTARAAGLEEVIKSCWGDDCEVQNSTVERINRCRRGILRWKKRADLNSRNKIT